jgi:hypothetical protein
MFSTGATSEELLYWMGEDEDTRVFIVSVLSTIDALNDVELASRS